MAKKARKKAKAVKASATKRKPVKAKAAKKVKKATKAKAKKVVVKAKTKIKKKAKRAPAKSSVVKTMTKAAKQLVAAAKRAVGQGPKKKDVIGEGNYTAARNFRKKETAYIENNRPTIARKAKEAEAAIDGPEGAELEAARVKTAAHGKD